MLHTTTLTNHQVTSRANCSVWHYNSITTKPLFSFNQNNWLNLTVRLISPADLKERYWTWKANNPCHIKVSQVHDSGLELHLHARPSYTANTADGIRACRTPFKHLCVPHNRRKNHTSSHNPIPLAPMMPSGQTGDANEGSPQIPHSFERHTTAFVWRGQFDTADTHGAPSMSWWSWPFAHLH